MNLNRIAIIPAKGNSKRIKNKNIKLFCGKPIISYPLKALTKSGLFKKIHISTESNKVKKITENLGHKIDFMRPKSLCKNKTILLDVLKYVVEKYEKQGIIFDEIWLIYPCNPFLSEIMLKNACKSFYKKNRKYPMLSLREFDAPIEWAFKKKKITMNR